VSDTELLLQTKHYIDVLTFLQYMAK